MTDEEFLKEHLTKDELFVYHGNDPVMIKLLYKSLAQERALGDKLAKLIEKLVSRINQDIGTFQDEKLATRADEVYDEWVKMRLW